MPLDQVGAIRLSMEQPTIRWVDVLDRADMHLAFAGPVLVASATDNSFGRACVELVPRGAVLVGDGAMFLTDLRPRLLVVPALLAKRAAPAQLPADLSGLPLGNRLAEVRGFVDQEPVTTTGSHPRPGRASRGSGHSPSDKLRTRRVAACRGTSFFYSRSSTARCFPQCVGLVVGLGRSATGWSSRGY